MKWRMLLLKGLLCSNLYLITFFKTLNGNGLSNGQIVSAISVGTATMIFGDIFSSYCVDRWGPRRIVIMGSLLQMGVVSAIPFCTNFMGLIGLEILMGISFPIIYGADSKWLKRLSQNWPLLEHWNQNTFWMSQIISVLVGLSLLHHGAIACFLNAAFYGVGFFIALSLPDITTRGQNNELKWKPIWENFGLILKSGFVLGIVQASSWIFQARVNADFQSNDTPFAFLQLIAAALSLSGGLITAPPLANSLITHWLTWVVLISVATLMTLLDHAPLLSWSLLFLLLFLRGTINLLSKKNLLDQLDSKQPVAMISSGLTGFSKLVQSGVLALVGAAAKF